MANRRQLPPGAWAYIDQVIAETSARLDHLVATVRTRMASTSREDTTAALASQYIGQGVDPAVAGLLAVAVARIAAQEQRGD